MNSPEVGGTHPWNVRKSFQAALLIPPTSENGPGHMATGFWKRV